MSSDQLALDMVEALNEAGVPFMIVGSFSSNAYGIARSTHDADFVVQLGDTPINEVTRRLPPGFVPEPQMSFETVTGTVMHRIRHPASLFSIELFLLSDDAHDRERFARRQVGVLAGKTLYLPTPEDVVITKLRWSRHANRQKDLSDVRGVLTVQGNTLDRAYLTRWCDVHGTRELLDAVIASVPMT